MQRSHGIPGNGHGTVDFFRFWSYSHHAEDARLRFLPDRTPEDCVPRWLITGSSLELSAVRN